MLTSKVETKYKPSSPGEIARLYGISRKTLQKWLSPHTQFIGRRIGRYYNTKQVRVIFERLGEPG